MQLDSSHTFEYAADQFYDSTCNMVLLDKPNTHSCNELQIGKEAVL